MEYLRLLAKMPLRAVMVNSVLFPVSRGEGRFGVKVLNTRKRL